MRRYLIALMSVAVTASVAGEPLVVPARAAAPASGPALHWAVSIRDPYLRGLGIDNVWEAPGP